MLSEAFLAREDDPGRVRGGLLGAAVGHVRNHQPHACSPSTTVDERGVPSPSKDRDPHRPARQAHPRTRAGDRKGRGIRRDVGRDRKVTRLQHAGRPQALPLAPPQQQDRRGLARTPASNLKAFIGWPKRFTSRRRPRHNETQTGPTGAAQTKAPESPSNPGHLNPSLSLLVPSGHVVLLQVT